ncbi:MAG TPA: hypothetical protein VGD65_17435 [Chryseosolibacter sp.]
MKYQWASWKGKPNRHQTLVDNSNPTKTTRMNGYGMGVTFTTRCFVWDKNFTSTVEAMQFFEPLSSC